jgi:hypothetical protein
MVQIMSYYSKECFCIEWKKNIFISKTVFLEGITSQHSTTSTLTSHPRLPNYSQVNAQKRSRKEGQNFLASVFRMERPTLFSQGFLACPFLIRTRSITFSVIFDRDRTSYFMNGHFLHLVSLSRQFCLAQSSHPLIPVLCIKRPASNSSLFS